MVGDLFELAKSDCGLDVYEVSSREGWHRHITLSHRALASLEVVRRRAGRAVQKKGRRTDQAHGARGAEVSASRFVAAGHAGRTGVAFV